MTVNTSWNKALEGRDANTGRFVSENNGGGRPKGSRNKLTTEFIDDLYAKWQEHGPEMLERVIRDDPAAFMRTVAQILPKEIDANVNAGRILTASIPLLRSCRKWLMKSGLTPL